MDTSLSSSRPKHQRNCVAITEIIQFPHKHSKSSDIRILEQFKYRCQEKKTLKENSNIKKMEFRVTRKSATTGTHLGDPGHWLPWHQKARIPANSNDYVMVAKSSGLSALEQKHSHSFDFKATFKARIDSNKRCFCVGKRSANCIGPSRVGWTRKR